MLITHLADAASQSGQRHIAVLILDELEALAQRTPSPTLHAGLAYARPVLAPDDAAERLRHAALGSDLRHHPSDHPSGVACVWRDERRANSSCA
jgi:hypothetical protein